MATYAEREELIRLGAYRAGSSAEVDEAIRLHEPLESFLSQAKDEVTGLNEGYRQLEQILRNLETERYLCQAITPATQLAMPAGPLGDAGPVPRSDWDFWGVRVDEVT